MRHKINVNEPVIKSRAEMESLVGELAALMNEQNRVTLEMDAGKLKVAQQFEDRLGRLKKRIEEKTTIAAQWADMNPAEFGNKKSIEFVHATVGFRTGTPKVLPLKKSFTVELLIALLLKTIWGVRYIRQLPSIDKDGLIADRKELGEAKLAEVGLKIVQDESFFVTPKGEALQTTVKEAA